jgi:hypothetical protein
MNGVWQICLFARINAYFGSKYTFMAGIAATTVMYASFPMLTLVADARGSIDVWVYAAIGVQLVASMLTSLSYGTPPLAPAARPWLTHDTRRLHLHLHHRRVAKQGVAGEHERALPDGRQLDARVRARARELALLALAPAAQLDGLLRPRGALRHRDRGRVPPPAQPVEEPLGRGPRVSGLLGRGPRVLGCAGVEAVALGVSRSRHATKGGGAAGRGCSREAEQMLSSNSRVRRRAHETLSLGCRGVAAPCALREMRWVADASFDNHMIVIARSRTGLHVEPKRLRTHCAVSCIVLYFIIPALALDRDHGWPG